MLFLTPWFWSFFVLTWAAYMVFPSVRLRISVLLAFSVYFQIHFAGWRGFPPIVLLTLITYGASSFFQRSGNKNWLNAGITINVLALVFYKYLRLFSEWLMLAVGPVDVLKKAGGSQWVIPLGISFFVFEYVHYLVEVGRGMAPSKTFTRFWMFGAFYPTMVSGPIKRFPDFNAQLDDARRPDVDAMWSGLSRVVIGCFKKIVIAEPCHAFAVLFEQKPSHYGFVWLLVALSLQIYFDFAGYSDMAIGISKMLGFRVPENFDNPYGALNISDFWRRWHMSLSTWIRDYIYIPLGGNRVSKARKAFNGALSMFICGLWHGAALHFGLWGLWHGLLLSLNGSIDDWKRRTSVGTRYSPFVRASASFSYRLFTLTAVAFGWLLFFYDVPSMLKLWRARGAFF